MRIRLRVSVICTNVLLTLTEMKIVLDTNCLIMAISSRNKYHSIWKSFLAGKYVLCVTNEIIEEYVEVIGRNISATVADMVVYTLLTKKNVQRFDPHFRFHLIESDNDDNKFVDCAINSGAKFIVTEDHHFNVLKKIPFPHVDCIGIDAFTEMLRYESGNINI